MDFKDYECWRGKPAKTVHARFSAYHERYQVTACGKEAIRCTTAYAAADRNTSRGAVTCKACLKAMESVHFRTSWGASHACGGCSLTGTDTSNPRHVTCEACLALFDARRGRFQGLSGEGFNLPPASPVDFGAAGFLCETCGAGDGFHARHPDTGELLPFGGKFRSTLRGLEEGYHGVLHDCTEEGEMVRLIVEEVEPPKAPPVAQKVETLFFGVECPFLPGEARNVPLHEAREAWQGAWDALMQGPGAAALALGAWGAWSQGCAPGLSRMGWNSHFAFAGCEEGALEAVALMEAFYGAGWTFKVRVALGGKVESNLIYRIEGYADLVEVVCMVTDMLGRFAALHAAGTASS